MNNFFKKYLHYSIYFIFIMVMTVNPVFSQEKNKIKNDITNEKKATDIATILKSSSLISKKNNEYFPNIICSDIRDHKETLEQCWKAYQESLKYYKTGLEHRAKVFEWQHFTTRIIFFVVIFLVFSGIYFAWMQFKRDENANSSSDEQEHTVEISTSGIKVSSPVLGVIILTLSLAFFYLYLLYVYPITEIF
ncbi:MAG: hypothetical protein JKX76_07325 [Colwellia sp.]|nr:hypothetical protein [Colwellia sp.]